MLRLVAAAQDPIEHSQVALAAKRTGDVVLALLLLTLAAPVMLVIAVAVKVTSRGPVLFKQTRVGKGGQLFKMWKFRSMIVDTTSRINADPELRRLYEESHFKLPADISFITPVGRLIRKTSLDELPQLFHVLAGKMSMVGVRPIEPAELVSRSSVDRVCYSLMAPGITGPWQVSGRSMMDYRERCEIDSRYATDWCLGSDLRFLARTPAAVLRLRATA